MSEVINLADANAAHNVKPGNDVWPIGKKSAYYTCFIAFFLGLFDLVDRQVVAALFPYLKAEYALSDTQLGSLVSIVNISIAVLVVPSAYVIDRWSRKKMMFLMGTIWSMATLACAFVGSYSHLFVARFICGAGEAGYNPAAQSLLAASFPRRLRTTAAGLAQFGMALGGPLGLVLGAYIAAHWGWRHAFGVVAIPGLILAIMALRIKDFKTVPAETNGETRVPYAKVLARLVTTPSLLCIYFAAALAMLFSSLSMSWLPSYFNRVAQFPMTTASVISAVSLITGSLIIVLCGPPVDWIRKSRPNGGAIWLAVSLTCGAVLAFFAYVVVAPGSVPQVAILMVLGMFAGSVATVGTAMVLDLTPAAERGTAVSLLILVQNIGGLALGPLLGGKLSDIFGLQNAMIANVVVLGLAAVLYYICIGTFTRDLAKVKQTETVFE